MWLRKILKGSKNNYLISLPKEFCETFGWHHGDKVFIFYVNDPNGDIYLVVKKVKTEEEQTR